jgi:hypothetical protein
MAVRQFEHFMKRRGVLRRTAILSAALGVHAVACAFFLVADKAGTARAPRKAETPMVIGIAKAGSVPDAGKARRDVLRSRPIVREAPELTNAMRIAPPALAFEFPSLPYYYRSSELTVRPVVLHENGLDLPLQLPGSILQRIALRLFIDEHGQVIKVEVEGTDMPVETVAYISDVFTGFRFKPGELEGFPVKSQLGIVAEIRPYLPPALEPTTVAPVLSASTAYGQAEH